MEYRPWTWKVPEDSEGMIRTISRQDAYERVIWDTPPMELMASARM